jgi:ADP-heptose:LPS heptosyltransferase
MTIIVKKLILWDFLQLLGKRRGITFLKKVKYFVEELLSRMLNYILKGIFTYKLTDSESTLRKLGENQGLEEIPCNLCRSGKIEIKGEKRGFRVVKCSNCGLRFVTPRFNGKGRKIFYYWKYHFLGYFLFNTLNKLDWAINEHLVGEQVLDIVTVYKKSGDLIEIGPFGQELTKIAQKKGLKCWRLISKGWVYDSPIEEREYTAKNGSVSFNRKKFDVVSCLDILDRVPDPLGELNGLQRILKDDGILLIRVPNYSSTMAEEKGEAWDYKRPWEEIYQFDYLHLKDLLDKSGFKIIDLKTELSEGVGYPGGLLIIARKKNYKNKKRNPKVLLIKEKAIGDVLLTTPIIRAFKEKYPNSSITFKTDFPEILENNPYLDRVTANSDDREYDVIHNLRYELFPEIPLIEAYARIAEVEIKDPQLEFYLTNDEKENIREFFNSINVKKEDKLAVLHPMVGGRIKSWNRDNYQRICDYLRSNNYRVITIGDFADCVGLIGAINLIGKTSIRMVAAIINEANIFFGLDSFPMHLANAFGIPSVVLFGSTEPFKVICRNNIVKIVQSDEKCLGCRHDTTPDRWAQNVSCRRGKLHCMEEISSEMVTRALGTCFR